MNARFTCCSRASFIIGAGAALAAAMPPQALFAANEAPPMSPNAALDKLLDGNRLFVRAMAGTRPQTIAERVSLAAGQAPFASILTCGDSRTTPEIIFSQGLGDIFVVRVAGNVSTATETASLEYASAVLKAPLIVVMGHSDCGAVKSAIELTKGKTFPSDIQRLLELIEPAVVTAKSQPGELLQNAIEANVRATVKRLRESPVLSDLLAHKQLAIVGAYYSLKKGEVRLLT